MISDVVRYDRLREVLYALLVDALGAGVTIKWAHDSVQRDTTLPAMVVLTVAGNLQAAAERSGGRVIQSPDTISFVLDSIAVGSRYSIYLNGYAYRHDAVGLETIEDVRDDLLAQIQLDTRSPYAATAVGTDQIDVTATPAGSLWDAYAMPADDWTIALGTTRAAMLTQRQLVQAIDITAFSKATKPEDGASMLAAKIRAALRMGRYQEQLDNAGVALLARTMVTDLSAIAGASWETRATFTLTVGLEAVTLELVDSIEDVTVTTDFEEVDGSAILTTSFTTPAV